MENRLFRPKMGHLSHQRSNSIMNCLIKLSISLSLLNLVPLQVSSSGVFEFRLISFINELSRDAVGNCCGSGYRVENNIEICSEKCQTFFRVCLKHYQTNIDPSPPCTFGEVTTKAFNDSSVIIKDNALNGLDYTIRFPFNFSWPGTFSLIVEAWHNASSSWTSSRVSAKTTTRSLITRLAMSRYLKVDNKWTQKSAHNNQTTLNYSYRVMCQENYFGEYCGSLCKPRDDKYGHFSCSPDGEKLCYPGWHGNYCEKAICRSGCNETNGECSQPNECKCRYGWEGHNCNHCTKYPGCLHGYCVKPWDCLCDEGWGGLLCNQDLNYCTNHKPCKNGGSCTNTGQGWYTCECPLGFTGKNCELEIDSCAHLPCANGGTCKSITANNYTCECPLGFFGKHCETMASVCTNNPCSNEGTCVDGPSGYLCICKLGYQGDNCQIKQTDCDPNPCTNGGSCVTTDDDNYSCICRAGFAGDNCELNINDCDVNPCFNSGTCIDEVNSFRCLCVPGFVGDLCQENVDDCLTKPCANGGTCLDLVNDYKCTCAAGYVGKDCSINIDECEPNPCLNGGICEDRVEEYFCKCPTGYRGQRCEINDITSIYDAPQPIFNIFDNSTDLPISVLSSEKAESLTPQQLIVIVIVSSSVPFMVIIATISIIVCKHRKNRLQTIKRKDEDEACRQNEQNLVTSMNNKCVDLHPAANVIVNALDRPPSLNHLNRGKSATLSKLTNEKYDSQLIYARQMAANEKAATLQKTKSNNKLLNTECGVNNNSRPVSKLITDHDNYDNNYDNNMSNIALMPNKDCIASHINTINTIERRGSLPHPHSVPNPLAKSESSVNNSTIASNRTMDRDINSQNNLHNNINIAATMRHHRSSGRSNHSIYVIEDHYSQPTYAVPEKLYATEV